MTDRLPRMTISDLNQLATPDFVATLGAVYEHSPWVAERVFEHRPFDDVAAVADAMADVVAAASAAEQDALIAAHPDLAGKLARAGKLAPASAGEQAGLGLDRLSDAEFEQFAALNDAYRARFGFPFIIAVKRQTRASVLGAFQTRLTNDLAVERACALQEIDAIARFRLDVLFAGKES